MPSHTQLSSLPTFQATSPARLKALYSDFLRQKHSNPTSYSSNVEWWRRTLEAVLLRGWLSHSGAAGSDKLVLHAPGPSLSEEFRLEGVGRPLALAGVIAELCELKAYYLLQPFLSNSQSIYDPGWLPYRIASYVVGKPLWWALQQLNVVSSEDAVGGHASDNERWKKLKGDYVVLSLLERAAEGALRKQQRKAGISIADTLYNFESFGREFATDSLEGATLSELDIKVLLKYLERDKKAVIIKDETIKFIDSYGTQIPEITAVDTGILSLKTAVDNLQAQVDRIQSQIDHRTAKISAALRQKRKEVAMTELRARKQFEELLRKRLGSLETLHSTLIRVEASAGDVEIMKSYESSTATLRAILTHPSLQREKIDETMDAMAAAHADARDIDDAIRTGVDMAQADVGIDDAELEDELNALLLEGEAEKKAEAERRQIDAEQETRQRLVANELRVPSQVPEAEHPAARTLAESVETA